MGQKSLLKRLNTFFALIFTSKTGLQESRPPEMESRTSNLPLVEEDQVREHLNELDVQRSMGP